LKSATCRLKLKGTARSDRCTALCGSHKELWYPNHTMSRAAKLVQTVRPILALGRLHRAPHAHSGSGEDLPHQPEPTVRPTEYHWVVREPDSIKADLAADTIMSCGPKAQRWRGTSASRPDDRVPPSVYAASASSNRPRPAPHRTTQCPRYPRSTHAVPTHSAKPPACETCARGVRRARLNALCRESIATVTHAQTSAAGWSTKLWYRQYCS
jgi:hypothetical protein